MRHERQRFDQILDTLERERRRVDEDLRRLTRVAAYLRPLLPTRHARRRRCTPKDEGSRSRGSRREVPYRTLS
jgi:hypothetical protein